MAGPASHLPLPPEVVLIDAIHHQDHPARSLLTFTVVLCVCLPIFFRDMAIGAVEARVGGKKAHGIHKFLHGNSSQDLNILKDIFRLLLCRLTLCLRRLRWALRGSLPEGKHNTEKADHYGYYAKKAPSPHSKLHVASPQPEKERQ